MHFAFIPYGAMSELRLLMRDMESQKFMLKMHKEGEKDRGVYISGQVRLLPFGVYEYVFPKEYLPMVLATLCKQEPNRYHVPEIARKVIRKMLKLKPLPKYETKEKLIWICENVSILPLGIREDLEIPEPKDAGYKDWWHESL